MNSMNSSISTVKNAASVGAIVRARRRAARLTQAQAAGLAGVGTRFLSELERGKKTLRFDHVLQVLDRLGLDVVVAPRGVRPYAASAVVPPPPVHRVATGTAPPRPAPQKEGHARTR